MRVIVIPRWAGTPAADWYPWMARQLASAPVPIDVVIGDMPTPGAPTIDRWTAAIDDLVGPSPDALGQTILVGHSVGCQALLHYLAARSGGSPARALVRVAGWWTVDEPWDTLQPWLTTPVDGDAVRRVVSQTRVLLSTDGPFTRDHTGNAREWQRRLDATVDIHPGAGHFNRHEEPLVWELLQELLKAGSSAREIARPRE